MNSFDSVRFLLVSWTIPPTASGSSVVVRNLLRWFTPAEAVMLGQIPFAGRIDLQDIKNHHRILIPSLAIHWRIKPWIEPFYVVPAAVLAGCLAVRRYHLQAVVAIFPNVSFLIAGYLIAALMGLPFFPYFHNLYVETRKSKIEIYLAKIIQKQILKRASSIFSMSNGMASYFASQYQQLTISLLHPLNELIPVINKPPKPMAPFKIGVSGNINLGSERALKNVIKAIGGNSSFQLILHAPVSAVDISERLGLWADNIVVLDEKKADGLVESLRKCDVLIIGLYNDWGPAYERDCRIQFPTRTLEMLAAGKPILVLCPAHYFLAEFFITKKCGLVLDSENPVKIRSVIHHLCLDNDARTSYVSNSLHAARDFDGSEVASKLRQTLMTAIKDSQSFKNTLS